MSNSCSNTTACTRHVHLTLYDGTVRGANDVTVKQRYHRQNLLHPYMFYAPPPLNPTSPLLKVQQNKSVTNIYYTGITFINNLYNRLNSKAVTKVLETE